MVRRSKAWSHGSSDFIKGLTELLETGKHELIRAHCYIIVVITATLCSCANRPFIRAASKQQKHIQLV